MIWCDDGSSTVDAALHQRLQNFVLASCKGRSEASQARPDWWWLWMRTLSRDPHSWG